MTEYTTGKPTSTARVATVVGLLAGAAGVFARTWLRLVGIVTALVAGTAATASAYRRRP